LRIRHALAGDAAYIFVLNNDTVLAPECIARLRDDGEANPGAVAAAPKSLYMDRPEMVFLPAAHQRCGSAEHVVSANRTDQRMRCAGHRLDHGCALFVARWL